MQFYQVHKCPFLNAYYLPEYAIKKVNVREGWQILSDIGHYLGVTWEDQNSLYSIGHPATVKQRRDQESFKRFFAQYKACLNWYTVLTGKTTVFHERINKVPGVLIASRLSYDHVSEEEATIEYLLELKSKFLSENERNNLLDLKFIEV